MSLREDSRPPSLFQAAALAALERAVNAALRADPATMKALGEHSGRLLAIDLTLPPVAIYALIVEDGIELFQKSDATPDVLVRGNAVDLVAQIMEWREAPSVIGGRVAISGDQELLRRLVALGRELDVDWGALVEPVLGDELAQQVDLAGRRLFGWLREAGARFGRQLGEFLRDESELLALRRDVYEFIEDVDELRLDVDRLEARIRQLKQQQGN